MGWLMPSSVTASTGAGRDVTTGGEMLGRDGDFIGGNAAAAWLGGRVGGRATGTVWPGIESFLVRGTPSPTTDSTVSRPMRLGFESSSIVISRIGLDSRGLLPGVANR